MAEQNSTSHPPDDGFTRRLEDLASAIEQLPPVDVPTVPHTETRPRRIYWAIAAVCALSVGTAEVGLLLHGTQPSLPAVPAEVEAAYRNDPCALRTAAIMDAIAAYAAEHGEPPAALAALRPAYLDFEPVDPVSQQPYGYQVLGGAVSLMCPEDGARGG